MKRNVLKSLVAFFNRYEVLVSIFSKSFRSPGKEIYSVTLVGVLLFLLFFLLYLAALALGEDRCVVACALLLVVSFLVLPFFTSMLACCFCLLVLLLIFCCSSWTKHPGIFFQLEN